MNSPISKCPECKQHTIIYLDKDIIHITCQCEYHFEINIKDFIKYNKKDEPYMSKKAQAFKDITDKVTRGSEDLLTYFTILKNEHINQLIRLINKLESSYDLSYTRNKNMLSYMQILIDNYDGSSEMKNSILDSEIKIYECKDSNNIEEVIKYFTGYNIIEHIKIEEVRTIKEHTTKVNSFLLLSDGRVASCSDDCSIRIYIPSKDFHCEQVLWRYPYGIYSICEADDGTIVSCTRETITIGENTLKNPHDNSIFKVIALPNNRIASCSLDNTIKIWKINKSYSKKPIRVLEGHGEWVTSLLYVKERDIMISGSFDNTIGGVGCFSTNSLYQIDKDRVIVGGLNSFSIVNIDKCGIEKTIEDETLGSVYCFIILRDMKTILCGCDFWVLCFYNMNTKHYTITKSNHNNSISDLLLLEGHKFLSCSYDKTIKVWKY